MCVKMKCLADRRKENRLSAGDSGAPPGVPAFVDQFPKVLRTCQRLVFGKRHLGTEKEIRERALVEHPLNDHRAVSHFEIHPVVLRPEAMQHPSIALDLPELIAVRRIQILFGNFEFLKELELLQGSQGGNFRRADLIEHDLKHAAC